MREYIVKTKKVGDSVIVELPMELLQAEQIIADITVKVTIQKYQNPSAVRAKTDGSLGPDEPWKLLE